MSINKLPYLYRKIGNRYFVSSELGSWLLLTEEELNLLKNFPNSIPDSLLQKLKDHYFLFDSNDNKKKEEILEILQCKQKKITKGPGLFYIGVTRNCNLKCLYCHLSSTANNRTHCNEENLIDKMTDFIFTTPNDRISIEFQGGEPLLKIGFIKNFIKIIKEKNKIHGKTLNFCITTNLTLLTEDILLYLIKEEIGICFTLDGDQSIQDFQRPFRKKSHSCYKKVLEKIDLLKKHKVHFGILTIVTKKSLGKEKEIVDFLLKQGIKTLSLNKVQKLGRAAEERVWNKIGITNEEFFIFWKNVIDYLFSLHKKGIPASERTLSLILDKLFYEDPNFLNWRNPGGEIIGSLGFDDEGNIYPSDEAREIPQLCLGNVWKHTYKDILDNSLTEKIIKGSILEGQICNYCAYKFMCGLTSDLSYKNTSEFFSRHWLPHCRCSLHHNLFDFIIEKILNSSNEIKAALFVHNYLNGRLQKEAPNE